MATPGNADAQGGSELVRMELSRILIRENNDSHIVELREVNGPRTFPIVIGLNEAMAIERRLMGQAPLRPYTHELLAATIDALGARLDRILITDLKNRTFFARLILKRDDQTYDLDSRPSDALALGAVGDTPIFVSQRVLEEVSRPLEPPELEEPPEPAESPEAEESLDSPEAGADTDLPESPEGEGDTEDED